MSKVVMQREQILPLVKNDSASLLFSSQQAQDEWFQAIRKKPSYQGMIAEIREEANRLLREPLLEIPFSMFTLFRDRGLRLDYEKLYFERRRRLNTFALMALIEREQTVYFEQLQDVLWAICHEYTWCLPAHLKNSPEMDTGIRLSGIQTSYTIDLFAAETAFTLSELSQLLHNRLDPLVQKRMIEEVNRRVLQPFLQQQEFEWETATHNWAAVCAGSIGSAALHLIEDEEVLATILERVLRTMDCYLAGFKDDGACTEGYAYWQYGFGYYTYLADLLLTKTAGAIDLLQGEKVQQIARFPQKCFVHNHHVVNFSDSMPTGTIFLGLMHYLNKIDQGVEVPEADLRAPYTADHCSRWAPAFRNLLWFDETKRGEPWANQSTYLRDAQWLISRQAPYVFACKGGDNDEPHNHNDLGHFMLFADGEALVKDLGCGMYCEDYFNEKRYSFLCNGSQGHSVPIINQQYQKAGRSHTATVRNVSIGKDIDRIEMELEHAYDIDSLQKLKRTFTWRKGAHPSLVLSDFYQFSEKPLSIVERFIIPDLPLSSTNDGIVLEGEHKLKITFDRHLLEWTVHTHTFFNHFGEEETVQTLDFAVREPRRLVQVEWQFMFL
ncbi:heparinase II/III family protein [Halalkalibacterium halodurans]|uniref:heparinase II/III family protein n=1 Tax=Halalkalibacterium halodurans TaxID=86665 RepID=UPI002AAA43A4|nr:heparinase II/III family protein [Halalkalibacterium halodurans]MDY7221492.1 hypothetical protein [Halalkalibacterium halodurans]MDY7240768.1 hypothetical protein [Halalkalibacterium halodurans]